MLLDPKCEASKPLNINVIDREAKQQTTFPSLSHPFPGLDLYVANLVASYFYKFESITGLYKDLKCLWTFFHSAVTAAF